MQGHEQASKDLMIKRIFFGASFNKCFAFQGLTLNASVNRSDIGR